MPGFLLCSKALMALKKKKKNNIGDTKIIVKNWKQITKGKGLLQPVKMTVWV